MRSALAVSVVLLLAGCGDVSAADGVRDGGAVGGGGDEPTTAAALAWVAAQHVGDPDSAAAEIDISGELGTGAVGAELLFDSTGEDDGDALVVAVGTRRTDGLGCTGDRHQGGCVETTEGTLMWETVAPEEDPGNVAVAVVKDGATVLVFQSGPAVSGDPRDLGLPISVEDMFAIAGDPRVDVTTSEEARSAGPAASYWRP